MTTANGVYTHPLPGELIGDRMVIASCPYSDDERGELWTVILLERTSPYFTVTLIEATNVGPRFITTDPARDLVAEPERHFHNIVNAVRCYRDDYGAEPGDDELTDMETTT